jgi:hypothetical protein
MTTVISLSKIGIEKIYKAQSLIKKSWEEIAFESLVAKSTIANNVLKSKPVRRSTILCLAKCLKIDRQEIIADQEWYPKWINHNTEHLWRMLQGEAQKDSKRFRMILESDKPQLVRETMHIVGTFPRENAVLNCNLVKLNEEIIFCINTPNEGHLILLEREPNGTIVCLSPSEFVPQNKLSTGLSTLPQNNPLEITAFGATEIGREELIACLIPEIPLAGFNWLETSRQKALVLGAKELISVLGCVTEQIHSDLWKWSYDVVDT